MKTLDLCHFQFDIKSVICYNKNINIKACIKRLKYNIDYVIYLVIVCLSCHRRFSGYALNVMR